MTVETSYNQIANWTDQVLANGRFSFPLFELRNHFKTQSDNSIKLALNRLTEKGRLLSVFKGYYLIIPPQYAGRGVLPPNLFLDSLMAHLKRPYYLALLNAAAYHGAAHQQPQEYFVISTFPVLRATERKGLKINYISIKTIPEGLINQLKTEAGYLNISNPSLTACDLIQFERRIGGITRAATVISELSEIIKPSDFSALLVRHVQTTTLQRLGYLLEMICGRLDLAEALFKAMKTESQNFFRITLKVRSSTKGFASDNQWNVIVNTTIDLDE